MKASFRDCRRCVKTISLLLIFYVALYFVLNDDNHDYTDAEVKWSYKSSTGSPKRIFCMILTSPEYLNTKVKVLNRTWAKDCDKYFFIVKTHHDLPSSENIPILVPSNYEIESYDRLTDKMFKTLLDVYKQYNDYDFYLKADDDTFVFVESLRDFLEAKNSTAPFTYGLNMNAFVANGYHSGGAGYLLSNEALRRIGIKLKENSKFTLFPWKKCWDTSYEDIDVARCLRKVHVYPGESRDEYGLERFHAYNITKHFYGDLPDWYMKNVYNPQKGWSESSISFHYMTTKKIEKLYALWTDLKQKSQKPYNISSILYKMVNFE